jgi:hypothetical protein
MARSKPKKRAKPAPKPRSKPKAKPAPKPRAKPKAVQKPRQAPRKGAGKARTSKALRDATAALKQQGAELRAAGRQIRTAAKKPTRARAELRKLAERPWKQLGKNQKTELRRWRGHKAAETVFRAKHERMAEELSGTHGRAARDEARRRIREEGSAGLARWLKNQSKLPRGKERSAEVRRRFAFWMYSP